MKPPPADSETMVECPLCAGVLTYGDARTAALFPVPRDGDSEANEGAGGVPVLQGTAVIECRCGRTAVDLQQRGNVRLAIPRPGTTLAGTAGPDMSVVL